MLTSAWIRRISANSQKVSRKIDELSAKLMKPRSTL